ncbi:selenide, water dikinase SelD [Leptothermofonsia sp. ETS-13]|uniref:selenide, water dikinase SelD n=1 Tax=Leptothermofonsia sp. ETS-13 TaxID=3035696 RepID=UPI003BA10209
MKLEPNPITKDLVLLGGGHSHAIALRMFGMKPLPGVRLTLITEASETPYSGMLPGHVAGFYSHEECHIDLRPLCQFARAQLYIDSAIGLDLENKRVLCANRPPVRFDVLSLDIGSTPQKPAVLGDLNAITPAKPVRQFLENWEQLVRNIVQNPGAPICLGVVGGGDGGVELALNMQRRLQEVLKAAHQPLDRLTIHLFQRDASLLPRHNRWVRSHFHQLLTQRGIQLHLEEEVCEVQPHYLRCKSGLAMNCDNIVWVTQASAPDWLGKAGLEVDEHGFVLVDDTLRSCSHPQIFATGDIATMVNHPRPKAGVFAVRQGKPLFYNLRHALQEKPLKPYYPQKHYLSLIGTGDGSAVASRGSLGWHSPLLWKWKDRIDRAFMERFKKLPEMEGTGRKVPRGARNWGPGARDQESNANSELKTLPPHHPITLSLHHSSTHPLLPSSTHPLSPTMRCAGCGAKVGSPILERVLQRIRQPAFPAPLRDDILLGLNAPDDAAVVQIPFGMVMVQTIDYFPALLDDPFVFGQIAANHALSDLFAMGAQPQSALAIATLPYASPAIVEETLYQLLSGALKILHEVSAELTGGHTTEGKDLAFGLACNGLADPDRLLRKGGMKPGQVLILTKAIGTGALFAANQLQKAKGIWIDGAIESMVQSNQKAALCLLEHQATACTDITGFGLIGHLVEMIRNSEQIAVKLNLNAVPLLNGALEITQLGIMSSLYPQNLQAMEFIENGTKRFEDPQFPLLFDPQTSGGLLAAVPEEMGDRCLAALRSLGYSHSAIIGHTLPHSNVVKPITLA